MTARSDWYRMQGGETCDNTEELLVSALCQGVARKAVAALQKADGTIALDKGNSIAQADQVSEEPGSREANYAQGISSWIAG
eukprot:5999846-Amphidinium_carterae.1